MSDLEVQQNCTIAISVCLVVGFLYLAFGLLTVIVLATLFDSGLRQFELRRARSAKSAPSTGVARD